MATQSVARAADGSDTAGRVRLLSFILVFLLLALITRLFVWQILRYKEISEIIPSDDPQAAVAARQTRGAILDRNGLPLALDTWTYRVSASPYTMGDEANRRRIAEELAVLLKRPVDSIWRGLADPKATYVILDTRVPLSIGDSIRARRLAGIGLQPVPIRQYPAGSLAAQTLGFVNSNNDGLYGIEGQYDKLLGGDDERCRSAVGATPARLTFGVRDFQPTTTACDLVLTLDWAIQDIVERELQAGIDRTKSASGTVVVIEPSTGKILAMASAPGYDPNRFYDTGSALFNNPAVSMDYEPGSVIKIMTMSAALDSGQFVPSSTMVDTGEIIVGGRSIMNWDKKGHGRVNMTDCLAMSLNVCSAYISTSIGPGRFYEYTDRFGFGKPTGTDIANEASGTVRKPSLPTWHLSDLGTNSFGQGMTATPLQVAMMAAAVANGGIMMKPYIVDTVLGQGQSRPISPVRVRSVVSSDTARTLSGMLAEAIEKENIPVQVPGVRIAGKTGTASVVNPKTQQYDTNVTIASFVGWAPVDDPKFVILVKLDKPQTNQFGAETAGPIFREIGKKLVNMLDVGSKVVNR